MRVISTTITDETDAENEEIVIPRFFVKEFTYIYIVIYVYKIQTYLNAAVKVGVRGYCKGMSSL